MCCPGFKAWINVLAQMFVHTGQNPTPVYQEIIPVYQTGPVELIFSVFHL